LSVGTIVGALTGIWTPAASMITSRYAFSGIQLKNGKILVTGGIDAAGVVSSVELYNPTTDIWSTTGSMKMARA
jgi:hypothetical protein